MRFSVYVILTASAVALAGCNNLPGSSLGATFSAESYLEGEHGGPGFNGALASEYTALARRAALQDELWMNSTAYINKAQQAEAGSTPAPWTPEELGVNGEASALYSEVVATIGANRDTNPEACARAQAMWDQYLEALRGGPTFCVTPDEARALLDEALAACAGSAIPGDFVVYFGFDRTDLTAEANVTLDEVVAAMGATGADRLSVVGHTDTVGSEAYNQGLSERRARSVGNGLVDRGVPAGAMTLAGRGERELAVPTGNNVREPLNRRVEITLSD